MSVTQNPITGRSSGAFGTAILQTQYGRNILRSKPLEVRNPRSAGQLSQRAIITKAGQMVKYMNSFITIVFLSTIFKMPAASWIVKHLCANALTAVGETVTLDTTKILPVVDNLNVGVDLAVVKSVSDQVTVTWDKDDVEAKLGETDVPTYGMCYDVAADTFYMSDLVVSSDESLLFSIPGTNSSKTFKTWVLFKRSTSRAKYHSDLASAV